MSDFRQAIRDLLTQSRPQLGAFEVVTSPMTHSVVRSMVRTPVPAWLAAAAAADPAIALPVAAPVLLNVPELTAVSRRAVLSMRGVWLAGLTDCSTRLLPRAAAHRSLS